MWWRINSFEIPVDGGGRTSISDFTNIDPYLIWHFLIRRPAEPSESNASKEDRTGILVEFSDAPRALRTLGILPPSSVVPGDAIKFTDIVLTQFNYIRSNKESTRFISILVGPKKLIDLLRESASPNSGVLRLELSETRRRYEGGTATTGGKNSYLQRNDQYSTNDYQKLLSFRIGKQVFGFSLIRKTSTIGKDRPLPLVCVVDDRCNFASATLLLGDQSRVKSIWMQGQSLEQTKNVNEANEANPGLWKEAGIQPADAAAGKKPDSPIELVGGATYGWVMEPEMASAGTGQSSRQGQKAERESEPEAYRKARYNHPTRRWSHGSAVLDLVAAGEVWGTRSPGQWWAPKKWPRSVAPPRVCFVQLPSETIEDTSGGSLASHVLDGIHHALESAQPNQQVIVNVSYGTHSGAHDGTSMFECAVAELLEFYDGKAEAQGKTLHVVLPAGNSHLWRCHASQWLCEGKTASVRELRWKVLPDNPDDSFLELWLPFDAKVALHIQAPDGQYLDLNLGESEGTREVNGQVHVLVPTGRQAEPETYAAAVIAPLRVPQSQSRRMVLVVVRASLPVAAKRPEQPLIPRPEKERGQHGIWTIRLQKPEGASPLRFDAWVQRADAAPGRGPRDRGYLGRQSYLLETKDCGDVTDGNGDIDQRCTMNGIATLKHDRLYVIGAMRRSDGSISHYSAGGPNAGCDKRFDGPDWVVPADESFNNAGLLTTGVLSGSRQRVPGTSMAAAAFTRLLYEHLARRPSADDLCGPPPDHPTRLPNVACGAPQHADPMHRGECVRLMPTNVDGTLDFPCAAGSSPPSCKRPA